MDSEYSQNLVGMVIRPIMQVALIVIKMYNLDKFILLRKDPHEMDSGFK